MEENKDTSDQFSISPCLGPFQFHAWLELPFPVAVQVDQSFTVLYKDDKQTELRFTILSDVYKVVTGSFWQYSREIEDWAARARSGKSPPLPPGWLHTYVQRQTVGQFVKQLEKSAGTRYVHVEEVPAVIDLSSPVPDGVVPPKEFDIHALMPYTGFFQREVLPNLQPIISAYRISAYPWLRYSILPVSEALVDRAILNFTDNRGIQLGRTHYGFDTKSPFGISASHIGQKLQPRFDEVLKSITAHQPEDQISSAYYLYRMRRWAEAVAVAASVVDGLLRDLVFQLASTEIEAKALWKAYRYKELFNDVLPEFNLPKFSEMNQPLWQDFLEAKEYRGAKVHGVHPDPFDPEQETAVGRYLRAFNDVARWLRGQMGLPWALDFVDDGKNLGSFP